MKKYFGILAAASLLFATAFAATSCNDDKTPGGTGPEEPTATLEVKNAPASSIIADGDEVTFDVESNTEWTITKSADAAWITSIEPANGEGNGQITVTVAANEEGSRSTALIVTAENLTKTVTISQVAKGEVVVPVTNLGDGSKDFKITENMTLTYPGIYNLLGWVYVSDGATLTIEPGVIIKGDFRSKGTLIIERGSKIVAQGSEDLPIVFTSSQVPGNRLPGDWGGLIVCGKAPNNKGELTIEGGVGSLHGGNDPADNSGVISYVRIEFAGIEYLVDSEINGLTLGSVGSGTKIDHVQVSHSGDDAFEMFGGTVSAKNLVAFGTWDDDFDTDNGYSGKIQYALSVRNPRVADKSASNGFESDGDQTEPFTTCVFANVSLFGPVTNPANYTDLGGEEGSPTDARFQAALHLRRNTQLSIYNSLIAAFPIGLIIENDENSSTREFAEQGLLNVTNCVMAGMQKNYQDAQYWADGTVINPDGNDAFVSGYFTRAPFFNSTFVSYTIKTNPEAKVERVATAELGYQFANNVFNVTFNGYYTLWLDKGMTRTLGTDIYNISGLNARHMGLELEATYRPSTRFSLKAMGSIGDWIWRDDVDASAYDEAHNLIEDGDQTLFIAGVHVGNSAQITAALGLDWEPFKNVRLGADYNWFGKNFADFQPTSRTQIQDKVDAWQMPDYGTVDVQVSYRFNIGDKIRATFYGNVNNLLDTWYIADARDGKGHDARSALVYYGFGRTWTAGLKFNF